MSHPPFVSAPIPVPPAAPAPLDAATVAVVLYVSPFTPADWPRLGVAFLARYVTDMLADPRFRVPELVVLVNAVDQAGILAHRDDFDAAHRLAPAVLAALSN